MAVNTPRGTKLVRLVRGDPLQCSGETFGTVGTLENWTTLSGN